LRCVSAEFESEADTLERNAIGEGLAVRGKCVPEVHSRAPRGVRSPKKGPSGLEVLAILHLHPLSRGAIIEADLDAIRDLVELLHIRVEPSGIEVSGFGEVALTDLHELLGVCE